MFKKSHYAVIAIIAISFILYSSIKPIYHTGINEKLFEDYNVTIYRDNWGVPHIFGIKDEDTAYGLAFAHAEDDFETIQNIILASKGRLAQEHGKVGAANDYMVQLLKINDVVNNNIDQVSNHISEICDAYADGLNHYALINPDKVIRGFFPVSGKDIIAGFVHRMPLMFGLDNILSDLAQNKKPYLSVNLDSGKKAHDWIQNIIAEPEIGKIY